MITCLTHNPQVTSCESHKISEWRWLNLSNLPADLFLPLAHLLAKSHYGKPFPGKHAKQDQIHG